MHTAHASLIKVDRGAAEHLCTASAHRTQNRTSPTAQLKTPPTALVTQHTLHCCAHAPYPRNDRRPILLFHRCRPRLRVVHRPPNRCRSRNPWNLSPLFLLSHENFVSPPLRLTHHSRASRSPAHTPPILTREKGVNTALVVFYPLPSHCRLGD